MKAFSRSKLAQLLITVLMVAAVVALPLSGFIVSPPIAHATQSTAINPSNIHGAFFNNPNNSGPFDVTPSTPSVFTQTFPVLNFNPPTSMQQCSNSTGVNEYSRPFTDVSPNTDGSCAIIPAQDANGNQAGQGNLFNFEAEFNATFSVPSAGQLAFNLYVDDGWILSMGPNSNGNQPTYVSGPMNNPPSSGKGPFTGYPVVGAYNTLASSTSLTVTVNVPAAGTYPVELDYTECCQGQLRIVSTTSFTPISSPTGKWIAPPNGFTVGQGTNIHFAAHAQSSDPNNIPMKFVRFTAWWNGVDPNNWYSACVVSVTTSGTSDVYECDWNLRDDKGNDVPTGILKVNFEVYDLAGKSNLSPDGIRQGTVTKAKLSFDYAGFVASGTPQQPNIYTDIKGSWTVPIITSCPTSVPKTTTAAWVGLKGGKYIEQTGTASECIGGKPHYYPWYEMFGYPDGKIYDISKINPKDTVRPGDTMQGEVRYQMNGNFLINLSNTTQGRQWAFKRVLSGSTSATVRKYAAWIFEDQEGNTILPRFKTFTFTSCIADTNPIGYGLVIDRYMVGTYIPPSTKPMPPVRVQVSPLNPDGMSFSVTSLST